MTFPFNKNRVKLLNGLNDVEKGKGILYWMLRDIRIQGIYTIYMYTYNFSNAYIIIKFCNFF